jgi:HlyD family type I secretion membrane fusion protein
VSEIASSDSPDSVPAIALELGGGAVERLVRTSTVLIVVAVLCAVLWTLVARIDELARARGDVRPTGELQVIESRDGGRIEEILVQEGDRVQAGQVIARFSGTRSEGELNAAQAKQAALEVNIERLAAFAEEREPDFSPYESKYPLVVGRARDALASQRQLLAAEQRNAEQKLAEKRAELAATEHELETLQSAREAAARSLAIYRDSVAKGLVARVQLADAERRDAEAAQQLAAARGRRSVIASEIVELGDSVEAVKSRFAAEALEKRSSLAGELRMAREEMAALTERVSENEVISWVQGTVQSLPKTRVGEIIEPGDKIAEIVPEGQGLEVVVRLSPRDVGFVRTGQPAKIKIDAFDYSRYGALHGSVRRISPTTFLDERGNAYYEVDVALEKTYFGEGGKRFELIPGMTGEVDIKTGDKTVFQYLWKPIYTNLDTAFSER